MHFDGKPLRPHLEDLGRQSIAAGRLIALKLLDGAANLIQRWRGHLVVCADAVAVVAFGRVLY